MTVKACVVGHPVAHSRSPLIHGHWLAAYGIDGSYDMRDVAPPDFDAFIASLGTEGFAGGNVTIPYKERAFALADETTAQAQALGAVNTLWFDEGKLVGANTDVSGFLANLDEAVARWQETTRRALVVGAGGAARAVVYGLLSRGVEAVTVANRSRDRAEALAAFFGSRAVVADWADLPSVLERTDLLVNATSLGMAGKPALDVDLRALPNGAVVYDIVYVPLETPLLAQARRRGLVTVDGLGMLLHQAVPGFERWFKVRPRVTPELRALIVADIEGVSLPAARAGRRA